MHQAICMYIRPKYPTATDSVFKGRAHHRHRSEGVFTVFHITWYCSSLRIDIHFALRLCIVHVPILYEHVLRGTVPGKSVIPVVPGII